MPVIPHPAAPRENAARCGSPPAEGLGDAVRAHVRDVSAYLLYLFSPRQTGARNPLGPNAGARAGVVDRGAGAGTNAWFVARQDYTPRFSLSRACFPPKRAENARPLAALRKKRQKAYQGGVSSGVSGGDAHRCRAFES